ncbi:radical SAM protein [Pseudonocardiaceae bacterium YIM PH 21723]|nr:radical SAM protein [Pseudonocardiaceae bacterium YIM PH 21723]
MRWDAQKIADEGAGPGELELPGLSRMPGWLRTVRRPEFAGVVFHEVMAKRVLNRVPPTSGMPFEWTINPYRGCSHACTYCFARKSHTYLDFDSGRDFDSQVVVKVNAAEVVGRELAAPRWARASVAMGTNTDPYQRAEGRYRLMPGIIGALTGARTPFSILTKGTLLARDLPLLSEAAGRVQVWIGVSLALLDPELQERLEPGTPAPAARLNLVRRVREAGLDCSVMVAPVLPYLTDSDDALNGLFAELAAAGATKVSAWPLHLRPGSREWFFDWLRREHPELVVRYERLYARGSTVDRRYAGWLAERVGGLLPRHRLAPGSQTRPVTRPDESVPAEQLALL